MKKTILALLLALGMMASVLAGCGNAAASAEASGSAAAAASEAAEAAEGPAEAAEADTTDEAAEASVADAEESAVEEAAVELPPYEPGEELTQVSMLFQFMPFFQSWFPEGWASSPWWDEFESRTNTEWDLREVSGMAWQENVNLLCASGDLPDVVSNIGNVYSGGVSGAIRDEMIVDLAPMIQENAPYYFSIVSQDEYTMKTLVDDDGQMGAMFSTLDPVRSVSNGLWIRKDWLDGLGMDVPTGTEELKQVLQGFKDSYGADIGLYQMVHMNENKVFCAVEGVWNAFGPNDFYLDEDGNVQFGPMQDYYFEYLAYLKDLAQDGLFLTSSMTDQTSMQLFASGGIGIQGDDPDNVKANIALLPEEEQAKVEMVPMAALGEPTEFGAKTALTGGEGSISISTNCENPEAVIHALDYLFTDEGAILSSYGIEGVSFEYVDGQPQFLDAILRNPDGMPARAAMGYFANPGLPGIIDNNRSQRYWDDVQKSCYGIWEAAYTGSSMTLPKDSLSLTTEELDSIAVYQNDMVTYATEWSNGVVFGDTELTDAEIESYRSTMRDTMHIDEITAIYQAAYDRFQERSFG